MRFVCMVTVLAVACLSFGQMKQPPPPKFDPQVEAVLAKMRAAYSKVKSAQIKTSFVQYGAHNSANLESECSYVAPASFRIKSTGENVLGASTYLVVTDGKEIHIEGLPGGPATIKYSLRDMVANLPQLNLEVLSFWDYPRQLSTERGGNMRRSKLRLAHETWNGKNYMVLDERAGEIRVRYFIDPATWLMWKTEQYDIGSANPYMVVTIDKMELNKPISASAFVIQASPKK